LIIDAKPGYPLLAHSLRRRAGGVLRGAAWGDGVREVTADSDLRRDHGGVLRD
jgi:hypothetical protein